MSSSQLLKSTDGGKLQSGMVECGTIVPFTNSYHNPAFNNQYQSESEQSWYPMYCYLYGITYDAIMDSYQKNQAQESLLHTINFQYSPPETDYSSQDSLNGISNHIIHQSSESKPGLKFKPFAAYLASEPNIARQNYSGKTKNRYETKKNTYRKGGYPYNIKHANNKHSTDRKKINE